MTDGFSRAEYASRLSQGKAEHVVFHLGFCILAPLFGDGEALWLLTFMIMIPHGKLIQGIMGGY